MDPLTAIGLASNILTFVDIATKVVTGTHEVYTSATGATSENAQIETITSDLRDAADDLNVEVSGKGKHERALKDLAAKCEKLSEELLEILGGLGVSGTQSKRKSLMVVIKSMRKEGKIAGMEKRLVEYRSQILLRLTMLLQ
jgi:hypothetical protein